MSTETPILIEIILQPRLSSPSFPFSSRPENILNILHHLPLFDNDYPNTNYFDPVSFTHCARKNYTLSLIDVACILFHIYIYTYSIRIDSCYRYAWQDIGINRRDNNFVIYSYLNVYSMYGETLRRNFFNPIRLPSFVENIFTNGRKKKEKKRRREIFKEKITIIRFFSLPNFHFSREKKGGKFKVRRRGMEKKNRESLFQPRRIFFSP